MRRFVPIFTATLVTLAFTQYTSAQDSKREPKKTQIPVSDSGKAKSDVKLAAERVAQERRAQARSLLLSLAGDARNFRDQSLRARVQARVADALWEVDTDQGRGLFRKAWEAAEMGDQEAEQTGYTLGSPPPNLRGEVLRLTAKRDRALAEEFLSKLKEEKQQAPANADGGRRGPMPFSGPRIVLAEQLLAGGDIERALQFADPMLGNVTLDGMRFLTTLREKDAASADRRYAALLANAEADPLSDANTVSLLASYVFFPYLFVTFDENGAANTSQPGHLAPPPGDPQMRSAFLRAGAGILMRPLPPPEQDQTSAGVQGKYLMVKRLLPLFAQYAPKEIAEALSAQLEVLAALIPEAARKGDEEWLQKGVTPEPKSEDRAQSLLEQIDHAKTSEERDGLYVQLLMMLAKKGDMSARDLVDKLEDSVTRSSARAFVDITLAQEAVFKKNTAQALELARIGELTHLQRVWLLSQAAMLLSTTDREKALAVIDQAGEEARRIGGSDADRPRALMAVSSALIYIDRSHGWDATLEAVRAANSADDFTGEDGKLTIRLQSKALVSVGTTSAEDFDVRRAFAALANEDYDRAVQLASGFQRDAPRATATIAIARAVLDAKSNPARSAKAAAKTN
jgi:hypothetical protein